jgi:molybdopterin/thiamine biosynthesis adenylyltransferase/nitroreductase
LTTLESFGYARHVRLAVLADKIEFQQRLRSAGFAITAYLPAWHLQNAVRYDCVLMTRRTTDEEPVDHGTHRRVQPGICGVSFFPDRVSTILVADRAYRAQLLHPGIADDRRQLDELRLEDRGVTIFDAIDAQLRDLVKARHPSRRLSPSVQHELVASELAGRPASDYGVWAFYPWSRRLVHLLDEPQFVELRTNRNRYKISPEEQASLARRKIGVVGLSVGQSVAVVLALERSFGELRLADFDTLDLSNLNRLRSGVHNLGVPKVYLTAREIAEIDPFLKIVCLPDGITAGNLEAFLLDSGPLDLVIEECDSIDLKIEIRYAARRHRIPVLMDTSDRGLLDIERFDLEPDRPIFHGAIGDLDPARLRGLSTEEKVPYVLAIIGAATISTRLRASLLEVEQSISTWPQLASAVAMGGAVAAEAARRILLGQQQTSGRFFVDIEDIVPGIVSEPEKAIVPEASPLATRDIASRIALTSTGRDVPLGQIRGLVDAGSRAPSGGNSQPWRWLWQRRRLFLFLDASRSRSLLDFRSLASVAALGAAAENLVLAAHAAGLGVRLAEFPLGDDSRLAATFEFCERGDADDEPPHADSLANWIPVRVTNRRHAVRQPLPDEVYDRLAASVAGVTQARTRWVRSAEGLDEAGRILGAGDRLLFLNERLHREMMSEIRFDAGEAQTDGRGIPVETLELNPSDRGGLEIARSWPALSLVRAWGGGRNLEKMSRKAIACSSAVGMLTMPGVERIDYFRGGRAFERLWLTAAQFGLALQPMTALSYLFARIHRGADDSLDSLTLNGLRELWPAWSALFGLNGSEAEVIVFRVSSADPPTSRAGRCPIDEILELG